MKYLMRTQTGAGAAAVECIYIDLDSMIMKI